jgi:RNA polymerase sigma factor (sigma-70 family)
VNRLDDLVVRARTGDLEAFGRLVQQTQAMAYAVAKGVLRDAALAEDAAQEAYLRAFRRLGDLEDPASFAGWLRRIVITIALNMRRAHRVTFLPLDTLDVPFLDEAETSWTELQRRQLAGALLTLTSSERLLCDRRYHGHWTTARLAREAGVEETVIRKRLQRIREKLRKEIEVAEQRGIGPDEIRSDFPGTIVELLARPKLTDLPENPVGKILELLRSVYTGFDEIDLPEIIDFTDAMKVVAEAMYVGPEKLQRVDDRRILRYDLTLPLLLTTRYEGRPLRLWSAGKTYRHERLDATHLEAFHQAEIFCLDERSRLDPWQVTAQALHAVDVMLPGRAVKIVPTKYPMCTQAWELEVDDEGHWAEVMAWGVFTDRIVTHLGADPRTHTAIGVGYGLERFAMVRFGIDDIRKIDEARVA